MLSMKQIETIKDMQKNGTGPGEIAEKLNIDRKTANKFLCIKKNTTHYYHEQYLNITILLYPYFLVRSCR